MMPNELVVGCMLDALVCNGEDSEAVAASLRCSNQGLQRVELPMAGIFKAVVGCNYGLGLKELATGAMTRRRQRITSATGPESFLRVALGD